MKVFLCLGMVLAWFLYSPAQAAREAVAVPEPIAPFIPEGYILIDVARADLDGDGVQDFLTIIQEPDSKDDMDEERQSRTLQVITAQPDGSFALAASSERAVLCAQCGGIWGDPFDRIETGRKTFTIHHYGGSNWRWVNAYQFNYSRIDKAWQLVSATESSFHTSEPDKEEVKVYKPRHFGKINLGDFDPQTYIAREE